MYLLPVKKLIQDGVVHRISRSRMRAPISCLKNVSTKWRIYKATELARRRFVGKAKPFFVFKTSQSSAHTIKFVLASMFFFWITFHFTSSVCLCVGYKMKPCTQISDSGSVEK